MCQVEIKTELCSGFTGAKLCSIFYYFIFYNRHDNTLNIEYIETIENIKTDIRIINLLWKILSRRYFIAAVYNLLYPCSLFQKQQAKKSFKDFYILAYKINCMNSRRRKSRQDKCRRNYCNPWKHTVKQNCNQYLSSGAYCKICGIGTSYKRHDRGRNRYHIWRKIFHRFTCIVYHRKQTRTYNQN